MSRRPVIRVLRHLARSGGTMISRCLGCMDRVALLSEVHPRAMHRVGPSPVRQACEWFRLISPAERTRLDRPGASFLEFVTLIEERARARNLSLVIREWSHIDYTGVPFAAPTMRPALAPALEGAFEIVQTATVRHPVDQWLSLNRLEIMNGRISIEDYLSGVAAFSQDAARVGFVRFEDLTRDPDAALRTLCDRLRLDFDPGYRTKWFSYDKITGDLPEHASRAGAGREIRPLARREVDPALLDRFRASADYQRSCELLGYDA